jgi:hypothetical protein
MDVLVFGIIFCLLILAGTLLSLTIASMTCGKGLNNIFECISEGFSWAVPVWIMYFCLHSEYTAPYVLPIFSTPFDSPFLGKIYAMILITCVATAKLFHTTDIALCVPSKDELKQFAEDMQKNLKKNEDDKKKDSVPK